MISHHAALDDSRGGDGRDRVPGARAGRAGAGLVGLAAEHAERTMRPAGPGAGPVWSWAPCCSSARCWPSGGSMSRPPVAIAVGVGFRTRSLHRPPHAGAGGGTSIGRRRSRSDVLALDLLSQGEAALRSPDGSRPRPALRRPNLLWIVLDTLRADRMSLYGYPRPTTPAAGGVGEGRDHLRHGTIGGPVDTAVARDDVHRTLAVRARRLHRPSLFRAFPHPGRAPAARTAMRPRASSPTCGCATPLTAWGAGSIAMSTIPGRMRSASRRR